MGSDDMGGTGAGRITGLQGELGNSGGNESVTIQQMFQRRPMI